MVKVVNEPQTEYEVANWQIKSKVSLSDELIIRMENNSFFFYPLIGSLQVICHEKTQKRLSSLRGKMTKQSEKEIDDQISELRNEWERNI